MSASRSAFFDAAVAQLLVLFFKGGINSALHFREMMDLEIFNYFFDDGFKFDSLARVRVMNAW